MPRLGLHQELRHQAIRELAQNRSNSTRSSLRSPEVSLRVTGRKGASPALVLRGSARLVAGLATRRREVTAADLAAADPTEWKRLRAELEERRQRRVDRRRYRRDPEAYLKSLENDLHQSRLPP